MDLLLLAEEEAEAADLPLLTEADSVAVVDLALDGVIGEDLIGVGVVEDGDMAGGALAVGDSAGGLVILSQILHGIGATDLSENIQHIMKNYLITCQIDLTFHSGK